MSASTAQLSAALAVACAAAAGWAQPAPASAPGLRASTSGAQTQAADYPGRVRAAILPYILQPEGMEGNPRTEVKVTTRPNGDIVEAEVVRSSGQPAWDRAVRLAVLRAGRLPLDVEGKVPPELYIVFRPIE